MPGFIGVPELLVLGIIALLVFGPKRLPEMGRSLGHGLREFKDSVTGDKKEAAAAAEGATASPAADRVHLIEAGAVSTPEPAVNRDATHVAR